MTASRTVEKESAKEPIENEIKMNIGSDFASHTVPANIQAFKSEYL